MHGRDGQDAAICPTEDEPLRNSASDPKPTFVDGPVVCPAQKQQVVRVRLATFGPMFDVVGLQVTGSRAAGKLAGSVPAEQGPPERCRYLPGLAADMQEIALRILHHRHMGSSGGGRGGGGYGGQGRGGRGGGYGGGGRDGWRGFWQVAPGHKRVIAGLRPRVCLHSLPAIDVKRRPTVRILHIGTHDDPGAEALRQPMTAIAPFSPASSTTRSKTFRPRAPGIPRPR
jgi:hypothetical protein